MAALLLICPVAGKSLNCPDESRLSSVRFLLFPFGLASPALRRFHRHATGNGWTRKSCITAGDSWQGRLPKSLLIEEKVLNVVKRMRCSRRSGVAFYYSRDNDHCVVYTSPPPAAEPLLKEKPFGKRALQLSLTAAQWFRNHSTPPWHADRRSAQGVRSTTEGEIFKGTDGACADPGTQNFPCHGGGAAGGQGYALFSSN